MDSRYNEYIVFLKNYRDELASYLEAEREKRLSLLNKDMVRLEAMIKVQQAETMKFRSMESKREKLQSELGLPDLRAEELLSKIEDAEARKSVVAIFAEMTELAEQIREQNGKSLELAEFNLKMLETLRGNGGQDADSGLYSPDSGRRKTSPKGSAFEETV